MSILEILLSDFLEKEKTDLIKNWLIKSEIKIYPYKTAIVTGGITFPRDFMRPLEKALASKTKTNHHAVYKVGNLYIMFSDNYARINNTIIEED